MSLQRTTPSSVPDTIFIHAVRALVMTVSSAAVVGIVASLVVRGSTCVAVSGGGNDSIAQKIILSKAITVVTSAASGRDGEAKISAGTV